MLYDPGAPALLFISASVLCAPGVDAARLEEIADAIQWARERYPVEVFVLKSEGRSDAFRRAERAIGGEHLDTIHQTPTRHLRRVLRQVTASNRALHKPGAVWFLTDGMSSAPTRKDEVALAGDIQAKLSGTASFRILGARLGYPVRGDDLLEVFMNHDRERAKAPWDEPEF